MDSDSQSKQSHKSDREDFGGLRELPKDNRDYRLGNILSFKKLPEKFELPILSVKHQRNSDFCSAFATCYVSEMQEKVELQPEWTFAASKVISGDKNTWGQDLRTICKAHITYGAVTAGDYTLQKYNKVILRDIKNYPDNYSIGARKKKSYFRVDDIKSALYEGTSVVTGLLWGWDIKRDRIENLAKEGYGHALCVIGWNKDYYIVLNSYGSNAGKGGKHYIHKDIIEKSKDRYGAYTFIDLPQDKAKIRNNGKIKDTDNWIISLIKRFYAILLFTK